MLEEIVWTAWNAEKMLSAHQHHTPKGLLLRKKNAVRILLTTCVRLCCIFMMHQPVAQEPVCPEHFVEAMEPPPTCWGLSF